MEKLWLSPEILEWENFPFLDFTSWLSDDSAKLYSLLDHAKKKIENVKDDSSTVQSYDLGDAMFNLKQVIERREKQISDRYKFEKLEFIKTNRLFGQLQNLGITQPLLAKKISDIRNIVAHELEFPTNKQKSKVEELWEFTWYFLRATDVFLARSIYGMLLYPPDRDAVLNNFYNKGEPIEDGHPGCLYLQYFEPDWEIKIKGSELPLNLFSFEKKKGWIEIEYEYISGWPQWLFSSKLMSQIEKVDFEEVKHYDEENDEARRKHFKEEKPINLGGGKIIGPLDKFEIIVRRYLKMYTFR